MKIAVVGAGAIGGYLGTRLSLSGQEVTFIARRQNLQAIAAHGFFLTLPDGTQQHAREVRAVEHMLEAGPQDVVLLTLKAHQLSQVAPQLQALIGPQTMVVSMVNGLPWWYFHGLGGPHQGRRLQSVDPGGLIDQAVAHQHLIGSVVYPACELIAPGHVKLIEGHRFTLGELDGSRSPRIEVLSQAFMQAGFKAPISKDIRSEIWLKLWGNLSLNPISALTRATLVQICNHSATRAVAVCMMQEAQSVAEQLGASFKISLDQRLEGAKAVGEHKTSMLQDLEQGRPLELQALVGSVIELAQLTHTPVPTIETVHALVSLLASTSRLPEG